MEEIKSNMLGSKLNSEELGAGDISWLIDSKTKSTFIYQ